MQEASLSAATVAEYLPLGQEIHQEAEVPEYLPATQSVHVDDTEVAEYLPDTHSVHVEAEFAAYLPAVQSVHPVAPEAYWTLSLESLQWYSTLTVFG